MNYFLYNPKSNNDNNELNIITEDGDDRQVAMKICLLDLDVKHFASQLCESDRVFICGGDGTLHHFANNAYGIEFPCPLYVIRSGTGNDFLNDIGQKNNSHLVDIREFLSNLPESEINGEIKRKFINGVGFGLDGEVCRGVEEFKKKNPKKKANYTTVALKLLMLTYKRPNGKVTVDGVTYEYNDIWAVSTMKGKYYGGGLMIAPTQERSSGKLSVMVMHGGTRTKALTLFAGLGKGSHVKCKKIVEIIEGDEVFVEFDSPAALQIDGEVYLDVTTYSASTGHAAERKNEAGEEQEALSL
ncbi:MAG: diacylglycerol kinase family protein [Clostridia bacterium]|nr:diacylglycerol kinase family protein [Clostridia bacterium]